jgi:hypothetical protein
VPARGASSREAPRVSRTDRVGADAVHDASARQPGGVTVGTGVYREFVDVAIRKDGSRKTLFSLIVGSPSP